MGCGSSAGKDAVKGNPKEAFIKLNNGVKMPKIGLGTWMMSEKERDISNLKQAILEEGYRHIDTATLYGNEETIGEAVAEILKEGTIKREDLFITTKVWHDEVHDPISALKRSLERLKMDYVD